MNPLSTPPPCLPGEAHHWMVTEVRLDGLPYTREECIKCKTVKTVLKDYSLASGQKWRAKPVK